MQVRNKKAQIVKNINLKFVNQTARSTHCLSVCRHSVNMIMEWYGSHYAGDDYSVYVDGSEIPLGINGERAFDTVEGGA